MKNETEVADNDYVDADDFVNSMHLGASSLSTNSSRSRSVNVNILDDLE